MSSHSPLHKALLLSPRILTPEPDMSPSRPPPLISDLSFSKHPIKSKAAQAQLGLGFVSSSTESDDDPQSPASGHNPPISLLSQMLNSPDQKRNHSNSSTAFSSPSSHHHGLLSPGMGSKPATSILRRESTSAGSDAGEVAFGLGVQGMEGVTHRLEKVEERRERIAFAGLDEADKIEKTESAPPTVRTPQSAALPRPVTLKFAMAPVPTIMAHSASEGAEPYRSQSRTSSDAYSRLDWRQSQPDEESAEEALDLDMEENGSCSGSGSATEDEELIGYPKERSTSTSRSRSRSVSIHEEEVENEMEIEDDDSDLGYQEDEEDGFDDDEEDVDMAGTTEHGRRLRSPLPLKRDTSQHAVFPRTPLPSPSTTRGPISTHYPFARPTNYRRRKAPPSPPPAPALEPPPQRRGRGHIQVAESATSGKEGLDKCSRHVSPPPSKSRSPSRRGGLSPGRLSEAGPRNGRAGSPMPPRLLSSGTDDNDEDEEETPPVPLPLCEGPTKGWRSDDSVFSGPTSKPIRALSTRAVSAPARKTGSPAVFSESDDEDGNASVVQGVRGFLRRASEHLQGFNRPVVASEGSTLSPTSQAPYTAPILQQATCEAIMDHTPALASSISKFETNGLTERLERTLSTNPASNGGNEGADLSRARSLGARVKFGPEATGLGGTRERTRTVSYALSADEGRERETREGKSKPMKCPVPVCQEDLGWTDEARLRSRKELNKEL
ncbi:hypothetical protein P7C73_g3497, partial [Tremellales sp. Uapishka_1]